MKKYVSDLSLRRAKVLVWEEFLKEFGDSDTAIKEFNNPAKTDAILDLVREYAEEIQYNYLKYHRPLSYQVDFYNTGNTALRRGLLASNRSGKSVATCTETAYHLTGLYPDDWGGKVFEEPITTMVMCESWELTAKVLQDKLIGTDDIKATYKIGTGYIPKKCIKMDSFRNDGPNVHAVEIKHVSGGYSKLYFGNYTQAVRNLQGFALDLAVFDEQPPDDVFSEVITRTATRNGQVLCSFTPLKGLSGLVQKFWDNVEGYHHLRVTWDDIPEYDLWGEPLFLKEAREQLYRDYMPHERDARTKGIPMSGRGAVFPFREYPLYKTEDLPHDWPERFCRFISFDLGLAEDPTVISFLLYDEANDIIYLHNQLVLHDMTPYQYGGYLITKETRDVPIGLPPDAATPGKYTLSEQSVREVLEDEFGLDCIPKPILNPPDSRGRITNSISYGVNLMRIRMENGKMFINETCSHFLTEASTYVVDEKGKFEAPRGDHCIDSARYGVLGLIQGYGKVVHPNVNHYVRKQKKWEVLSEHYQHGRFKPKQKYIVKGGMKFPVFEG